MEDGGNIGHFNVFNVADLHKLCRNKPGMPYSRRTYYKISLINGKNKVEYADKVIDIDGAAILFSTPRIPYRYIPQDHNQKGHFCIFTRDFLTKPLTGMVVDDMPIFSPQSPFVYSIDEQQYELFNSIFERMHGEMESDYAFKYDLLRNYVMEMIHHGQKLKPFAATEQQINAATRISGLFIELLERQFPIESTVQTLTLRTAGDYAGMLGVHVNHLNKVVRETTGLTTTAIVKARIAQEARQLLKHTNWNISEIAYSLGFEEVAHFSNFFKKETRLSPLAFRDTTI